MRIFKNFLIMVVASWLFMLTPARADDGDDKSAKEYQIKAVFLYNFIKFVQWPSPQALSQTRAATICVAGENYFGSALDLFGKASTPQLALNIKLNVTTKDIPGCHILYISRSEDANVEPLLEIARSYPILTVSGLNGFIEKGGVIEMVKTEKNIGLFSKDKINLRINLKQAEAAGLRIDAQLLEIAAEVIK